MLAGYTLSKSTDNGSGIRTLNGDTLFPQNSFCLDCEWGRRCSTCAIASSRRSSTSCRSASGKPFLQRRRRRRNPRRVAGQHDHLEIAADSRERCYVGTDRSNTGGGQDRPNVTGLDPTLPGDQQTIARWFNTDAYVLQPLGTFGNAGRNTFIGPGHHQRRRLDHPQLPHDGSKTLQFRLEAFNVLNNPIWNDPNTTLTSPLYGHDHQHEDADARAADRVKFVF